MAEFLERIAYTFRVEKKFAFFAESRAFLVELEPWLRNQKIGLAKQQTLPSAVTMPCFDEYPR